MYILWVVLKILSGKKREFSVLLHKIQQTCALACADSDYLRSLAGLTVTVDDNVTWVRPAIMRLESPKFKIAFGPIPPLFRTEMLLLGRNSTLWRRLTCLIIRNEILPIKIKLTQITVDFVFCYNSLLFI